MARIARAWIVLSGALALVPQAATAKSEHNQGVIPKFIGTIDRANADRLLNAVIEKTDSIIGLQVDIEPSKDSDLKNFGYLVSNDDDQFVLSKGPANEIGGGVEMVLPKRRLDGSMGAT